METTQTNLLPEINVPKAPDYGSMVQQYKKGTNQFN
jgi:hypothetical protein